MEGSPVNIFIFCFNEEVLLPHTIKHFKTMLPNSIITICDNESTDNSVKIAKENGCKIFSWHTGIETDIHKKQNISNTCWNYIKEGWVIVCDMDEWLCVTESDLLEETKNGTTILSIKGYNITGKSKDIKLKDVNLHSLDMGYLHNSESKNLCFRLPQIKEMNYGVGAHNSIPKGIIKYSLKTYINKHLNEPGLPFLINKMINRFNRTKRNRLTGKSIHYSNNITTITNNYNRGIKFSHKLSCDTKGYCYYDSNNISIITPCSRPQNLKQIYNSIKFDKIDKWYIIYDTSKCRTYDFQFELDNNTQKIIEISYNKEGYAGHPQINYALDLIKDGFVYVMDDDNIFHPTFWTLLDELDDNLIYTWDQDRIQEGKILKGGNIIEEKIDTSQFIIPRSLIGSVRWVEQESAGDFKFISKIHKIHKGKFKYIPKVACYHNFIKNVCVALCFFGLTRSLKLTIGSINKYLFKPLNNHGIKYDTYLHTYNIKTPYSNPRTGEKNIILNSNEYTLLEPTFHMVEDKEMVSKKLDLAKYRTKGDPWGNEKGAIKGNFTSLDNHILYLWSQRQLTQMVLKLRDKYTHIIFCRPDVLYKTPLNINWFSFQSKKIYIPNFGLFKNVNDRFAIGMKEDMIIYGQRFNDALEYSKQFPLYSESYLEATLKQHTINYEHINFHFIRIRSNGRKEIKDLRFINDITRRNRDKYRVK